MLDKNILIKNLEDFKDTKKYNLRQLAEFLSGNEITKAFFQQNVDKINQYIEKNPELIEKYSEDKEYFNKHSDNVHYDCYNKYTEKEKEIIYEIITKHLITFWVLDQELKNKINLINLDEITFNLIYDVIDPDDSEREDFIDYIIKFCIIPYSENEKLPINLTETELKVLEYIHKGFFVPQIAKILNISKYTVENHKKHICSKIDDLNVAEYSDKKALAKLHLFAQNLFK